MEKTLARIFKRNPSDFRRLKNMVRAIIPFEDPEDGDLGQYCPASANFEDPQTYGYGQDDTPCVIKLLDSLSTNSIPGVLAHELGHAATTENDRIRRGATSDEWRSELAADWYAYKWGFGREIAKQRKSRDWVHHGPKPGAIYEESFGDGRIFVRKVSRNFVAHLIEVKEGDLLDQCGSKQE